MTRRRRYRSAPTEADRVQLAEDLERLAGLNIAEMRELWLARLSCRFPPKLKSPVIFRGMLGYKLRAQVEGDLSSATRRKLREIEAKVKAGQKLDLPPRLNVGVRLEREWRGILHEVDVIEGGFLHQGVVYRSLSETANAITGQKWSGPRFFGLKDAST